MAASGAVYIASISGGKCITNTQQARSECRLQKWVSGSESQQWTIERRSEEKDNIVAFKSVSDGKYLAGLETKRKNGGKIGVSDRQWFELVQAKGKDCVGPGLFHVMSTETDGACFNDEWGRWQDDNKLQTYQYEAHNPKFNTFYFIDAAVADAKKLPWSQPAVNAEETKKKEDLEAREKAVEEREAASAGTQKDLEEQVKQLKESGAASAQSKKDLEEQVKRLNEDKVGGAQAKEDFEEQVKKLQGSEASSAQSMKDLEERLKRFEESGVASAQSQKELEEQLKQSQEREAAGTQKQQDLEEQLKKQKQTNAAAGSGQKDLEKREKALKDKENAITSRRRELDDREQALKEREAAAARPSKEQNQPTKSPKVTQNGNAKSDDQHDQALADKEEHLAQLHRELVQKEADVARRRAEQNNKFALGQYGTQDSRPKDDAQSCGHKVYRPPRKLNRKVAGYLYK